MDRFRQRKPDRQTAKEVVYTELSFVLNLAKWETGQKQRNLILRKTLCLSPERHIVKSYLRKVYGTCKPRMYSSSTISLKRNQGVEVYGKLYRLHVRITVL